jgi:hypothetical protein
MRGRAHGRLTAAIALPLMVALGLPGTFSVVVCRFGAMTTVHDCCPSRSQKGPEGPRDPRNRVSGQGCCSMRAVTVGAPVAEHSGGAEGGRGWVLAKESISSVASGPTRSSAALLRPAARAVGPPLTLLKQSFLL